MSSGHNDRILLESATISICIPFILGQDSHNKTLSFPDFPNSGVNGRNQLLTNKYYKLYKDG